MRAWLAVLLCGQLARAATSLVLTPRFEDIQGESGPLAQRGLLRGKFSGEFGPYSIYLEGFGEGENLANQARERRLGSGTELQEAYVEFKLNEFYLRAGKQSLRWSEMWITPSLDIWTSRRWNRFLYDPLPEQLDNSGGVSATYARQGFSLEAVVMNEPARNRFPAPLPEDPDDVSPDPSYGGRAKFDVAGFTLSALAARVNYKDYQGGAINYAFDSLVPKLEVGRVQDRSPLIIGTSDETFLTAGIDFFLGDWTLQPQFTRTIDATLGYFGGTWHGGRHDVQFQVYGNGSNHDFFLNVFYGYNVKDWCQLGAFVQDYRGSDGGLFTIYQNVTGGWVGGLRAEFNAQLSRD